jgi:hypothetical protein
MNPVKRFSILLIAVLCLFGGTTVYATKVKNVVGRITYKASDAKHPRLNLDIIKQIADLPEVELLDYNLCRVMYSDDFENPTDEKLREEIEKAHFWLSGIGDIRLTELKNISLVKGRNFTPEELLSADSVIPVLISTEMAKLNKLKLKSRFNLSNEIYYTPRNKLGTDYIPQSQHIKEYEFQVIGIFELGEDVGPEETKRLSAYLFVPEPSCREIISEYINEFFNLASAENSDPSWQEKMLEDRLQLSNNIGSSDVRFFLKSDCDLAIFREKANQILPHPYHLVFRKPKISFAIK